MGAFNAQDIANMAWAFAKADQSDELLFPALTMQAYRCMGEFNAQGLANTVWALATLYQLEDLLFVALAMLAEQCASTTINAQSSANTA